MRVIDFSGDTERAFLKTLEFDTNVLSHSHILTFPLYHSLARPFVSLQREERFAIPGNNGFRLESSPGPSRTHRGMLTDGFASDLTLASLVLQAILSLPTVLMQKTDESAPKAHARFTSVDFRDNECCIAE